MMGKCRRCNESAVVTPCRFEITIDNKKQVRTANLCNLCQFVINHSREESEDFLLKLSAENQGVQPQTQAPSGAFHISSVYKPFPHQICFHQSQAKCRLQVGSFGSGKSMPLLWEGIFHALEYHGSESIIFRKTVPDLKRSVIANFEQNIPKEIYADYNQTDRVVTFHPVKRRRIEVHPLKGPIWQNHTAANSCMMLASGKDCLDRNIPVNEQCPFCRDHEIVQSKLHFGAIERDVQVNKYLSTNYVYIGFEELGEFGFFVWNALRSRNRCPIPGSRPCMAGATNPFGVGWGWIKRLWVDGKPLHQMRPEDYDKSEYEYIHSTIDQNPVLRRDKEYMAQLERDPRRAQVRFGDLNAISGSYFENFEEDRHVRPISDFIFRDYQPVTLGWDYGFGHWFFTVWVTKATLKPRTPMESARTVNVFFREIFNRERTPAQQVEEIVAAMPRKKVDKDGREEEVFAETVEGVHFSWERFNRTTSNYTVAMEVGDLLDKAGLPRPQSSAQVERIAGFVKMYQLLEDDELFFVKGACPVLVSAFQNVTRGDGITTDLEDVVKPKGAVLEDDAIDAARYGVAGMLISPEDKPKDLKRREELDSIQDPMARFVAGYKHYNEDQKAARTGEREIIGPTWMRRIKN